ncbi:MAG: type II toxin-antitoxin system RelE/ParE family toxin [Armatimonadetes bacterium]|nr:type II toxin-antitoxin system RelE/ParE family toxin [Armatimonadota bacterium]
MAFRIEITPLALADIADCVSHYAVEASPSVAKKWLQGLDLRIESLRKMPRRCSLAPERDDLEFEVRQLRFKSHRVMFLVEGDKRSGIVIILRVYHSARRPIGRTDIGL